MLPQPLPPACRKIGPGLRLALGRQQMPGRSCAADVRVLGLRRDRAALVRDQPRRCVDGARGPGRGKGTAAAPAPRQRVGRSAGHRGRPLWRADLFDRLDGAPGNYAVAHYHPQFAGDEPSGRNWDQALTADPWAWLAAQLASLGGAGGDEPWPLSPEDAADLNRYADEVVAAARGFAPELCHSAEQCYQLTQDARDTVQVMIKYLERPELLDRDWVSPWTGPV